MLKEAEAAAKAADRVYLALLSNEHRTPTVAVYQGIKCASLLPTMCIMISVQHLGAHDVFPVKTCTDISAALGC